MSKKPLPRIIAGAVITMIAIAAIVTFTRGETPATDTASASVPGVSNTAGPVVEGTVTTPKPSSSPSADTAERDAADDTTPATTPAKAPVKSKPTKSPSHPPKDPDPTQPPPSPTPTPKPCNVIEILLGCR